MSNEQVAQWVSMASQGDRGAFTSLVEAYQRPVCAVAYSVVGDRATSEDVAQEAFIAAWNGLSTLRSPERFSSWLFAITRNIATSAIRRGVRERSASTRRDDVEDVPPPDARAAAKDTADAVWESLETLPDLYRETMVLYYREGESTAAVAETLGISEETVRQRLSRGRKMLRDKVAHLVEDVLRSSGPSTAFAGGVVAGLALTGSQAAVAQTGLTAAAAGKGMTTAGQGAFFGNLAFIAGPLIGVTGGYLGMWASIRNAPTLTARRYMLRMCAYVYAGVWLFLGYQFGSIALLGNGSAPALVAMGVGWLLYIPAIFALSALTNHRIRQIVAAEVGPEAAEARGSSVASCTQRHVWNALGIGFPLALIGSFGLLWMAHTLPGVSWAVAAAAALACHGGFLLLFRAGARLSADDIAFEASGPSKGPSEWLTGTTASPDKPSPSATFANDVGALAGSVIGSSLWIFLTAVNEGEYLLGFGFELIILVLFAASALVRRRRPAWRRWVFFYALMLTGVASGIFAWRDWPMLFGVEAQMSAYYDVLAGLVVFGVYTACAACGYFVVRERDSND